jgi:hypothetical protein
MLDFDFKSGREPEKHKISREECEYIIDFAFSVEMIWANYFWGCTEVTQTCNSFDADLKNNKCCVVRV